MQRREFLVGAAGLSVSAVSGCGSILHPERCGQPHSHELDWKIAALDGLGLLLFFVPGVIAFVVDFYTGAIYLPAACPPGPYLPPGYPPPGYPAYGYPTPASPQLETSPSYPVLPAPPPQASQRRPLPMALVDGDLQLARIHVPRESLTPQHIEWAVARHTGQSIRLAESQTRLSPLPRLDAYASQCRQHESDHSFGFGIRALLHRWQQA